MVDFRDRRRRDARPRLDRLQHMQGEIFRQLALLMPDAVAREDVFESRVDGSPVLRMELLERHRYTHFVRLTYTFDEANGQRPAPDAHIRIYYDARLAEVTAFNAEQAFRRSAHPAYPTRPLLDRGWRENSALDKWLAYLLQQGHSFETMRPSRVRIAASATNTAAVELA